MSGTDRARLLLADLATALGIAGLTPDADGGIRLSIGDDVTVSLYAEGETVLVVAPIGPLPAEPGYGAVAWLLRRNLYRSDIAPFVAACDDNGTLLLWARLPAATLDGARLASLLDALAGEAVITRNEVGA
jgi:hypothetical protein